MFELTVPASATDHTIGLRMSSVTVIEYGDFECPNASRRPRRSSCCSIDSRDRTHGSSIAISRWRKCIRMHCTLRKRQKARVRKANLANARSALRQYSRT